MDCAFLHIKSLVDVDVEVQGQYRNMAVHSWWSLKTKVIAAARQPGGLTAPSRSQLDEGYLWAGGFLTGGRCPSLDCHEQKSIPSLGIR